MANKPTPFALPRDQLLYDANVARMRAAGQSRGVQGLPDTDYQCIARHVAWQPNDKMFNVAAPVTLLANAVTQVVVTTLIPANMLGVLRYFATGLGNFFDFNSVVWSLRIGPIAAGTAVQGLAWIQGPISQFWIPIDSPEPIFSNEQVELVATNLTAAPITLVTGLLRGHYFGRD